MQQVNDKYDEEIREVLKLLDQTVRTMERINRHARPLVGTERYLSGEDVRVTFGLSNRTLQNYRDQCQIP